MNITMWYKIGKDNIAEYNHFEIGTKLNDYPEPLQEEFKNQKSWKNSKWIKKYAVLKNNKIQ